MATTEEIQARLDSLEAALALGVLTVEHDGKRVTYRSVDKMRSIINELKRQLGQSTKGRRTFVMVTRG